MEEAPLRRPRARNPSTAFQSTAPSSTPGAEDEITAAASTRFSEQQILLKSGLIPMTGS